jgi:hypothetical protein
MEWYPGAFWTRSKVVGAGEGYSASNQERQVFRGPCIVARNEPEATFVPQWVEFEKAE